MADDARIIALANGEAVGEVCPGCTACTYPRVARYYCNGTGRIRTKSENEAERMVALLRYRYDKALEALEAERAAHQRELDRVERVSEGLLAEVNAKLLASEKVNEETKQHLRTTREDLAMTLGALHRIANPGAGERTCEELARLAEREHEETKRQLASYRADASEADKEFLEMKRQLAQVRERVCVNDCLRTYFSEWNEPVVTHTRLCEEVRRG